MIPMREGRLVDSRDIASGFGKRHHTVLAAIDLVLAQCPAAASHIRFEQHAVMAGLGGTRYVRHVLLDRYAFMLLAMGFPTSKREVALDWAFALNHAREE